MSHQQHGKRLHGRDASMLLASYRRNLPALVDALQKAGLPSSWLTGWELKLIRLAAAEEEIAKNGY
jgi:hypothetical protein